MTPHARRAMCDLSVCHSSKMIVFKLFFLNLSLLLGHGAHGIFGSSLARLRLALHCLSTVSTPWQDGSSMSRQTTSTSWVVRPAELSDREDVHQLLQRSYSLLLRDSYDSSVLNHALPLITVPQTELLTCGTWYVVESNRLQEQDVTSGGSRENISNEEVVTERQRIVGCGGWTWKSPPTRDTAVASIDAQPEETETNLDTDNSRSSLVDNGIPIVHLRHFATDLDFLGQGIGRSIWNRTLRDIMQQAQAQLGGVSEGAPVQNISVEVLSTRNAKSFYSALGFHPIHELELPLLPNESLQSPNNCLFPAILMRCHLAGIDQESK
jgi:GNAT superfamily N-acetyltransferase